MVEKIGVEKTVELIKQGDLVLIVVDAEEGLTEEDYKIIDLVKKAGKKYLLLINKIDLVENIDLGIENNSLKFLPNMKKAWSNWNKL